MPTLTLVSMHQFSRVPKHPTPHMIKIRFELLNSCPECGLIKIKLKPNYFYLRVFTIWFDRESIIPGNFAFAISVCRLRVRGRMSKSVYVRVFHDLELLRYVLRRAIERQL